MKVWSLMVVLAGALGAAGLEPATARPAAAPTAPAVTPLAPQPFVADYQLLRDGLHIANAHFALTRDGEDGWTFTSETRPAGIIALLRSDVIVEKSAFRMGAERPIPLYYNYEHHGSSKDRDAHYTFDWQHERILGSYRGKPVDLPLARGTLDPLTLRLAAGYDLARGVLPPSYAVIERRQIRQYSLVAIPAQRVKVGAGEYDAQGVSRNSDDGTKTTRFLYAPALGWAPVIMEQDETDEAGYRLELLKLVRR